MKIIIENQEWSENQSNSFVSLIQKYGSAIVKELRLVSPIIIILKKGDATEKHFDRAMYDEGKIIIYNTSPDPFGDFLHELGHQLFRLNKISYISKAKLINLKNKMEKEEGDGRIFIQPHTYKNVKEIFSTIFKWYVLGKIIDNGYLEVLNNFIEDGEKIVDSILMNEIIIKSKVKSRIVFNLKKSISELHETMLDTTKNSVNGDNETESAKKVTTFSGYKTKGKIKWNGLTITIENKKGDIRRGVDPDGVKWETKMNNDYGYINGTRSNEPGDHLDCFIGNNESSKTVYIVKIQDPETKIFDEDKAFLKFGSKKAVLNAFKKNYDKKWKKRIKQIKMYSIDDFRERVLSGNIDL